MKTPFTNVEVKLTDIDLPFLGFRVGGLGIGGYYVEIHLTIPPAPMISRLEGNETDCYIKFNHKSLDESFLKNIFHMCRCYREKERTGINRENYLDGYKYFRDLAINDYKRLKAEKKLPNLTNPS